VEREEHPWDTGNSHRRPSGLLWPKHGMGVMRITSCPQIDIYTTKTNYIRFQPQNIFVNSRLGYVEPVAAPITTALFTAVPPWLLHNPTAYIDYTYEFEPLVVTDEALYPLGGRTYQAINQFWTDDTVTVTVDSVEIPSSDYTLDRFEGTVTFDTVQDSAATILLSYAHKMPFDIPMATGIIVTDLLGYSNINASGLGGLSGIRVEEIELRQSSKAGYNNKDMHPAAAIYLSAYTYASWA
jgi:hypothetical protein